MERVYKQMKKAGAANITVGVLLIVLGITFGILNIVAGGKLLKLAARGDLCRFACYLKQEESGRNREWIVLI